MSKYRDQLITGLYFVGYRDLVLDGIAHDNHLITGETSRLIESIDRRFSAMDDSGRRAVSNAIRRYFPLTDFQIRPGVTTEVFNLDLRVSEEGAATRQRYSFHQAGNDWVLINIATRAD